MLPSPPATTNMRPSDVTFMRNAGLVMGRLHTIVPSDLMRRIARLVPHAAMSRPGRLVPEYDPSFGYITSRDSNSPKNEGPGSLPPLCENRHSSGLASAS